MPVEPSAEVSPEDLFFQAARGNPEAQAQLSGFYLDRAAASEMPLPEGVGTAELWARMAATRGHLNHLLLFSGVILVRSALISEGAVPGTEEEAAYLHGEAVAVLSDCADRGSEEAAEFVNLLVEHAGQDVLNLAKAIRAEVERQSAQDSLEGK